MRFKEGNKDAVKHGTYTIRARGEAALSPVQRSQVVELREQLSTRAGAIEALKEAAVSTLTIAQVAQSYCVTQHENGKGLDDIPLLKALPAFWNSAGRAVKAYLEALPKEDREGAIDLEELRERYGHNNNENK